MPIPRRARCRSLETREPAFGVPARWIQPSLSEQAMAAGYSVVDPTTVIATHLGEVIRREAHRLLGRAETKRLLDSLQETHPKLIEELVPKLMTLGEVQRVLQQLLREQVSIRDLGSLLEVMVEAAATNKNTVHLVETIRQSMGRTLMQPMLDAKDRCASSCSILLLKRKSWPRSKEKAAQRLLGDGSQPSRNATTFLTPHCRVVEAIDGRGVEFSAARCCSVPVLPAIICGAGWSHLCPGCLWSHPLNYRWIYGCAR